MTIEKLRTASSGMSSITVTLSYEECRDLATFTYWAKACAEEKDKTKDMGYVKEIHAKVAFLFDMIKHGNIQPQTAKALVELNEKKEEE